MVSGSAAKTGKNEKEKINRINHGAGFKRTIHKSKTHPKNRNHGLSINYQSDDATTDD